MIDSAVAAHAPAVEMATSASDSAIPGIEDATCRLLLIGPLPPAVGGDTRLFSFLASALKAAKAFDVRVVNSSRGTQSESRWANFIVLGRTVFAALINARRVDVISFHASDRGMAAAGPLLYVLARLFRRRFICRLFGGSFDEYYRRRPRMVRALLRRTVLASDVCLFETRQLVDYFRPLAYRIEWFSNYTKLPRTCPTLPRTHARCERLIFLGHLWRTKGIDVILESIPLLPSSITIDLYGPLDDYSESDIAARGRGRVVYRGIITNEQALALLPDYDALVLPTFHDGEGYPGVILEAYANGLPVIASRWRSIPEIVDEASGILVQPESVVDFARAVIVLYEDRQLYAALCAGARMRSLKFGDVYWTDRFVEFCVGATAARRIES